MCGLLLTSVFRTSRIRHQDVEVSLFHPFVAAVSADGDLVLSNFDRINQRSTKVVQVTLYRLKFDKETATFTFVENIANQELKVEQRRWKHPLFAPEAAALHRTSWNRNWGSENLLASGGAGGLVRIDDVYT